MEIVKVERLDHLGIIAGVIKDLGIIEMIDARIVPDDQEEISTGEAVAGMIINGLGFSNRPISLTPQFFSNKPLEVLFREDISAEHFNRFKLGRSLDKVFFYGCDLLFSEIALSVCQQEGIDLRFNCLDTSSFSLTGEYIPQTDEQSILITCGYSKDHRPDLKQALLELIVSQDGGVPFISRSWDGNKVTQSTLTPHVQYARKGRPTAKTPIKAIRFKIQATVTPDWDKIKERQQRKACFVLSSNIADADLTDFEIFAGYKGQSAVEQGFRFLKDPVFFVSSLFVKKPFRIVGLLMVMTLALLVYSVAQRRLRKQLESQRETIENQIGQPTERPTLRWVFQLLEGINRVVFSVQGQLRIFIEGLTDLRRKILRLFGQKVCQIYQISSA